MSEPSDSDQAVDGGTVIDTAVPSGVSDHLRPRGRWRGPVALGAALAVGVGGTLLAVRPWEDDAKVPAAIGAADTQPGSGDGAAASRPDIPERRLVLDPVPEGLGALYIQDPARNPEQFQGMPEPGYAILLRAPGADYATGPWLSVGTQDLANFGGTFDPQNFFSGNNPRSVQIGEFRARSARGSTATPWSRSDRPGPTTSWPSRCRRRGSPRPNSSRSPRASSCATASPSSTRRPCRSRWRC